MRLFETQKEQLTPSTSQSQSQSQSEETSTSANNTSSGQQRTRLRRRKRKKERKKRPGRSLRSGKVRGLTLRDGSLSEQSIPILTNGDGGKHLRRKSQSYPNNNKIPSDLVDYEEGDNESSSSSTSLSSESENEEQEGDGESVGESSEVNIPTFSSTSRTTTGVCDNDNDTDTVPSKDEQVPCSSSSLRSRGDANPLPLIPSLLKMVPVYEDSVDLPIDNKPIITRDSSNLSQNQDKLDIESNKTKTTDKYLYSGLGRHFGKKALSSNTLLDDNSDDESKRQSESSERSAKCYAYFMRLKAVSVVILGTLLVLSISSLLFVFPIIVDPILLGMNANFSKESVNCRTTDIRSSKGGGNCSLELPSCREGCTQDVFTCSFVDVEYWYYENETNKDPEDQGESTETTFTSINSTSSLVSKNGTLYININGCGYPPEVNCSEFHHLYGSVGAEFKCFFSGQNPTFVVPYYNHERERYHLFLSILLPLSLSIFCGVVLLLLIKCFNNKTAFIVNRSSSKIKLVQKESPKGTTGSAKSVSGKWKRKKKMDNASGDKLEEQDSTITNGTIPKSNGHALRDTISGLMGMKNPSTIQQSIQSLPHQHAPQPQQRRYMKRHELQRQHKVMTTATIESESVDMPGSLKESNLSLNLQEKVKEHKL